jgi:membrane protein YdbS with pleckstrin-like domain
MSRLINSIISQGDEEVIAVVRPSLIEFFWSICIAIVLINLPFFLLFPLFQFGIWGVVAFATILVIALLFLLRLYLEYYYTVFVITNKRLIDIDHAGFFDRSVSTIPYGKINDVSAKSKGVINGLFKMGSIYITFTGDKKNIIRLNSIKRPHLVVESIMNQREEYLIKRRELSGYQAIKILKKIKKKLGEFKFSELISD